MHTTPSPVTKLLFAAFTVLALSAAPARAQVAGAITVYPTRSRLDAGTTQQFTAYVPISPNTVIWLVNGLLVARLRSEGTGSMPPLATPAQATEVRVRKPTGGHSAH